MKLIFQKSTEQNLFLILNLIKFDEIIEITKAEPSILITTIITFLFTITNYHHHLLRLIILDHHVHLHYHHHNYPLLDSIPYYSLPSPPSYRNRLIPSEPEPTCYNVMKEE
ncbi:hypothetical protein Glove_9g290 [Diversispora epigaea]|uniref:Uncharacterized protein n=1 Tax=Diversispora epigaea TaxID=1348612 RepID=A0A397JSE7_9GLOM|nr:hypothetical protein Glove_9g290 [Diversispora epigaea]